MPSRIIKESLLTSDTLHVLTGDEQALWWRVTVNADDHGRFDADVATLASRCYPKDRSLKAARVEAWLSWIVRTGAVALYCINGKRFGVFVNWDKHQRPRDSKPKYPTPPADVLEAARSREAALTEYLQRPAATCRGWRQIAASGGELPPSSRRYGVAVMEPQAGVASRSQATTKIPDNVQFTPQGFVIPDSLEEHWQEANRDLVIADEIKRAHAWAVANPQKHKSNWDRFLVNWFARARDRTSRNGTPPSRAAPTLEHRAAGITAAVKRMREEGKIP